MEVQDLKGKTVKVLDASEDELIIEVEGKKLRIVPTYECEYWDCSGEDDPSNPFLIIEEVEEG